MSERLLARTREEAQRLSTPDLVESWVAAEQGYLLARKRHAEDSGVYPFAEVLVWQGILTVHEEEGLRRGAKQSLH